MILKTEILIEQDISGREKFVPCIIHMGEIIAGYRNEDYENATTIWMPGGESAIIRTKFTDFSARYISYHNAKSKFQLN